MWPRSVAQERPGSARSGSGVAQECFGSDQEWPWNMRSGSGLAQECRRSGSGVTRSGAGVWPRSDPGAAQEWLRSSSGVAQE